MPTVHMIHGFVGAGKTTFAKKLEQEIRAVRFSPDEWMCDLYGNNPPAGTFREYENNIRAVVRKIAGKVLAAGADVILDEGFWTKSGCEETRLWARALVIDENALREFRARFEAVDPAAEACVVIRTG